MSLNKPLNASNKLNESTPLARKKATLFNLKVGKTGLRIILSARNQSISPAKPESLPDLSTLSFIRERPLCRKEQSLLPTPGYQGLGTFYSNRAINTHLPDQGR
jgi:hypothetical protein